MTSLAAPAVPPRVARRLTVILCAAAMLLALALPASSAARGAVVTCHLYAPYPNILISSARNMTCGQAGHDLRRYRGSISRRFRTPGGFRCARVSGGSLGGHWRCLRGARAYRFDFGD